MAADNTPTLHFLSLDAVRWAIAELTGRKVHPFFLAYLHLHRWSVQQQTTVAIAPHWNEMAVHLEMADHPPKKPYYRPFANRGQNPNRFWLNGNIAGSYATSSLRNTAAIEVIEQQGSTFNLKSDHVSLAHKHLLDGERLSAVAFGAFWFRDYGFVQPDGNEPAPGSLAEVVRRQFAFENALAFEQLFSVEAPVTVEAWFEPAPVGGST